MLLGKSYGNGFQFSKVISQNIFYPDVVRDNVVSNDVTITSALLHYYVVSDMIILGPDLNFLTLCRQNCGLFFSGHGAY